MVLQCLCLLIFQACGTLLYSVFSLHSYSPNTLTPSLKISSFQCLYGCCAIHPAFVSAIEKVLLFFCPSWQCHWSLPSHFWSPVLLDAMLHFNFFCIHPFIMYVFSFWRSVSFQIAAYMYFIDVHTGMFTDVMIACTFMFLSVISWSLFSLWLSWDNQSTVYRSRPGFYIIHTLYWWMCSMIHCNHWDNAATSLMIITNNGLSLVDYTYFFSKAVMGNISSSCSILRASHSILLYHHSALKKVLLVKAIGHSVALSSTLPCPQFMPSLTCNSLASRPIPSASVSRYSGLNVSKISYMHHFCLCSVIPVLVLSIQCPVNLHWCQFVQGFTISVITGEKLT